MRRGSLQHGDDVMDPAMLGEISGSPEGYARRIGIPWSCRRLRGEMEFAAHSWRPRRAHGEDGEVFVRLCKRRKGGGLD